MVIHIGLAKGICLVTILAGVESELQHEPAQGEDLVSEDGLIGKVIRRALGLPHRVPGYLNLARRLKSRSVTIVMYHGVVDQPMPVFHWCHLDVVEFRRQIEFIAHDYTALPLPEVLDRISANKPLPERTVIITFDDGFRSVHRNAFPILKEFDIPFTVFLVTSLIDSQQPPWPDRLYNSLAHTGHVFLEFEGKAWPLSTPQQRAKAYKDLGYLLKSLPREEKEAGLETLFQFLDVPAEIPSESPLTTLSWDEILELSRTGLANLGSHSHTHQILSRCSAQTQAEELRISRDILRERLGHADLFAYPNGTRADFTDTTKQLLRDLGYRCGLATIPGINARSADLYELKRVNIGADATLSECMLRMLGW